MLLNTSELPGVNKKVLAIADREKQLSKPSQDEHWVCHARSLTTTASSRHVILNNDITDFYLQHCCNLFLILSFQMFRFTPKVEDSRETHCPEVWSVTLPHCLIYLFRGRNDLPAQIWDCLITLCFCQSLSGHCWLLSVFKILTMTCQFDLGLILSPSVYYVKRMTLSGRSPLSAEGKWSRDPWSLN